MNIDEVLFEINSHFKYKQDLKWLDKWRILGNGKWDGDCEDYAITVIWLYSNKKMSTFLWNLITAKFMIWYCVLPSGQAHAVTKFEDLYFDNVQKKLVSKDFLLKANYAFKFPLFFPIVFAKLLISPLLPSS